MRQEAARAGRPYLVFRDGSARQVIAMLGSDVSRLTIGRSDEADICLGWDDRVSRAHAELERISGEWAVIDNGLSSNGTWVNDERVVSRKRLRHADLIRVGGTILAYCSPADGAQRGVTRTDAGPPQAISPAQRRVLVALCAPQLTSTRFAAPPGNQELADQLFLSLPSVKSHLRALFALYGIDGIPQGQKRAKLVELALDSGAVSLHDVT